MSALPVEDTRYASLESRLMHSTLEAAQEICREIGLSLRVALRQGCQAMITADHKPSRMNVGVCKDGFVTEVLGRG